MGGVVFLSVVLTAKTVRANSQSGYRLIRVAGVGLAIKQSLYLFANAVILTGTTGIRWGDVTGASFLIWGSVSVAAALLLAGMVKRNGALRLLCAAATVGTSLAASRLDPRGVLLFATAAYQAATATLIGTLPFLLLALAGSDDATGAYSMSRRLSFLAVNCVAILVGAGLLLGYFYTGAADALYGTTYGIMLGAKVILFGMTVSLARFDQKMVRQLKSGNRTNPIAQAARSD